MANTRNATITAESIHEFAETAAHFSLTAYEDLKITYIQPAHYQVLTDCPKEYQNHSYYGEAHYSVNADNSITIFISHRGTVLSHCDFMNDYEVYKGTVPESFTDGAKHFVDHVLKEVVKKFPSEKYAIVHTGHSLGAILAEVAYAYHRTLTKDDSVFAISFESPGSLPVLQDAVTKGIIDDDALYWNKNIAIYNADVNFINSCNPHYRDPYWIDVGYTFENSVLTDYPAYKTYFYTTYTQNQHSIVNIFNHFKGKQNIYAEKEYPVGRDAAYEYYMTYNPNAVHQRYWDEAIKHYWEKNPKIWDQYHREFSEFHQYVVSQLSQHQPDNNVKSAMTAKLSQSGFFGKPKTDDELIDEFVLLDVTKQTPPQQGCTIS